MVIWIDPPMWPAHDRLWCHVISDTSLEELHDFARRVGIPTRSFEGDHYDVPAERHAELVAAGATLTGATDLARRLRSSGLRFRKRKGERPLARVADGLSAVGGSHVLDVVASPHEPPSTPGAAVVLVRAADDTLLLVRSVGRDGWAPPGGKAEAGESARETAVREVREETGLILQASALRPVGYERITIQPGDEVAPWGAGDNHIAVYGTRLEDRPRVAPLEGDVDVAEWVSPGEARRRCGDQPWWLLVERWLEA